MIRTVHDGIPVVEGIENPYRDFIVGIQFHPENDIIEGVLAGKGPVRPLRYRYVPAFLPGAGEGRFQIIFSERFEPPVSAGGFFVRGAAQVWK